MKKLLILVYVIAVASLSISARADMNVPLLVSSIHFDQETQALHVDGQYPNPCVSSPSPVLVKNDKEQLILEIVGKATAEICISIVGPNFISSIQLHELKSQLSRHSLDENGIHKIYDRSGVLISEIDFSNVFARIPFESTEISGLLLAEENGLYLDGPHGVRIQVKSKISNMEELHNSEVTLTGHMIKHSVSQPVFNSNLASPQFIATGVSFTITD